MNEVKGILKEEAHILEEEKARIFEEEKERSYSQHQKDLFTFQTMALIHRAHAKQRLATRLKFLALVSLPLLGVFVLFPNVILHALFSTTYALLVPFIYDPLYVVALSGVLTSFIYVYWHAARR